MKWLMNIIRSKGAAGSSVPTNTTQNNIMQSYRLMYELTQDFQWRLRVLQRDGKTILHKGKNKLTICWSEGIVIAHGVTLTHAEQVVIEANDFKIIL